jgi:glycosyltransferase involved in cell wall biosynthesis
LKILWHSAAPWIRSGYGQQTAIWAPRLASLGHEVTISATYGIWGTTSEWEGIPVLPCGDDRYGNDVIVERFKREKADLLITLLDAWAFTPAVIKRVNAAHWMPVDCTPMSYMDQVILERGRARPIAFSHHGEEMMTNSGYTPAYIPHGIDTDMFQPSPDSVTAREMMGIDDRFVIGMNCVNVDNLRKGVPEQLLAFSRLYQEHSDALLLIHGQVYEESEPKGLNIGHVIRNLGLSHAVRFVDQFDHKLGLLGPDYLAMWYSTLDLYTSTSYAEGFGLTIAEALACGIPVVVTDTSAMPEVAGDAGWIVGGEPFWNPTHRAWWGRPSVGEIYAAYESAYSVSQEYQVKRSLARSQAMKYSADTVLAEHWAPVLESFQ